VLRASSMLPCFLKLLEEYKEVQRKEFQHGEPDHN
jgi:hypothetical protein